MFAEDALQLHSLDDAVEQRQGPDVIGAEFQAVGLGVFSRDDLPFGAAWWGRRAIGKASVRTLRVTSTMAGGNRRTWDQVTKRGRDRQVEKYFAEIMLLEL